MSEMMNYMTEMMNYMTEMMNYMTCRAGFVIPPSQNIRICNPKYPGLRASYFLKPASTPSRRVVISDAYRQYFNSFFINKY